MSAQVTAYVGTIKWFCDRCGEMFDENDSVEYTLDEGDRVPSAGAMDCYTENGGYHDELGELCEGCYELVQDVEDEDESFSSNPDCLIEMKKQQREVINRHLENLVKIAEVTS